jgi:hypothetical protein
MLISPKLFLGKYEEGLSFIGVHDYASEMPFRRMDRPREQQWRDR